MTARTALCRASRGLKLLTNFDDLFGGMGSATNSKRLYFGGHIMRTNGFPHYVAPVRLQFRILSCLSPLPGRPIPNLLGHLPRASAYTRCPQRAPAVWSAGPPTSAPTRPHPARPRPRYNLYTRDTTRAVFHNSLPCFRRRVYSRPAYGVRLCCLNNDTWPFAAIFTTYLLHDRIYRRQ